MRLFRKVVRDLPRFALAAGLDYYRAVAALVLLFVAFCAFLAFAPQQAIQLMLAGLWLLGVLSIVLALVQPLVSALWRL